jgi:hypothetical protein
MLNKGLFKVAVILIFCFSTGCGQNETPNTTENAAFAERHVDSEKKISHNKWDEFREGFKKKNSASEAIYNAQVKINTNSVPNRKITLADRINIKKWEEFQEAFNNRTEQYIKNIKEFF